MRPSVDNARQQISQEVLYHMSRAVQELYFLGAHRTVSNIWDI